MTKRNGQKTRKAILASVMSLLLSVSMFAGSTYAWFTDEVTSGVNQIIAGNLDVELEHKNNTVTTYESVEGETDLFKNAVGNTILWEPGAMAYETFEVSNVGTLALKYKLNLTDAGHNFVVEAGQTDPTTRSLLDVIKVAVLDSAPTSRETLAADTSVTWTTLADFIANTSSDGTLYPADSNAGDSTKEFSVVLYWEPGTNDFDNQYNLKNGAYASDSNATDVGQLYVNLGVTLVATQVPYEEDSFDNQYDAGLDFPNTVLTETVTKTLDLDDTTHQTTAATTITTPSGSASVTIPAGVSYKDSSDQPITGDIQTTLKVEPGTDGNITIDDGNSSTTYEVSLVNVVNNETVTAEGTVTYDVVLDVGVIDLQKFYHQGNPLTKVNSEADLVVDTNYFYDQTNGVVKFKTSHFSPFTAEYLFAGGIGTEVYPYLIDSRDMLLKINDYNSSYAYYKMASKNMVIDATDMPFLNLFGCFDGNGVVFNNVSRALFFELNNGANEIVVKNLTVNAHIARNSYFESAVALYPGGDIKLENVDVHGYVEGTAAASYIALGPGAETQIDYTFKNCHSDATIVAMGESAAGFIVHPYCAAGSTITLENSKFTGAMAAKGKTYYFRVNASGALSINTDEANGGELYNNPANEYTGNSDLYTSGGVIYNAGTKVTTEDIVAPEGIDLLSIAKADGAEYAVATLNIGPNAAGTETGNYMGVYINERCDLNNDTFTTKTIKNFNITINGSATEATGISTDGETFNIVNSYYGHTFGAAFVRIVQYDSQERIVKISTLNLKKS